MNTKSLQHKFNMKWERNLSFMVLLLALVLGAKANPVDMKTANKAAQSFLNAKMGSCPKIDLINFAEKTSLSNFYIFGNEHCFVIIAADDCVHPVLGYSTENAFGVEKMPENVYGWLKAYNEDVALAVNSKSEATDDIREEWNKLLNGQGLTPKTRTSIAPLLRTTWDQNAPYNNLCPIDSEGPNGHAYTGCSATCMAQILNYWEHPIRGTGSHSYTHPEYGVQFADFGATVYDWDNMKNSYSDGYTEEEAYAVATLMYHCGVAVDMIYGPKSSGAYGIDAFNAYKTYFDYNPNLEWIAKTEYVNNVLHILYTDEQWIDMVKGELNLMRPLPYGGSNLGSGGHAFICDGYDENSFFHFNWGWGGGCDGYYTIGALNPGTGSFNDINDALFYCFPNTPPINSPATINTTVNGCNVVIQWSNVVDASSYKLYRNGDLVASNLISTSYTDSTLLYGSYSYYVKSVAADGTMSLRSNISIADIYFPGPVPTSLVATVNNTNVNLSWTPPTQEDATLTYGDGPVHHYWSSSSNTYFAHRYLANDIAQYQGKRVSKIGIYIAPFPSSGSFTAYVFTNSTSNGKPDGQALAFESNAIHFDSAGWNEIVLDDPVIVTGGTDLWVVIEQQNYTVPSFDLPEYNPNACYKGSSSPTDLYPLSTNLPVSWFINVLLTDGIYTYNLYRNGNAVANNLNGSTYQDNNLLDDHYVYYVTTNYYGGESEASNEVEVMIGNPHYSITTTANPSASGSVSGGGIFGYGQTCTLTATPNTDYIFLDWTEGGNVVSTNATYSFVAESNRELTANFALRYNLVSVSSSGSGSVSGGGTYQYGQTCTLMAIPNTGYLFTDWTKDEQQVSNDATFTFTVTEDAMYTANFIKAPSGVLNGLFSVGDSKQVRFSQGNLQFQASTSTWRFAENQYDYIGTNNRSISQTNNGWIDLFGWGTSGWDNGNTCYHPWDINSDNNGNLFGPPGLYSLVGEYANADWGVYNPISNGGNQANQWRALTYWEWHYLLNTRTTSSGVRYAKAQVNGVNGLILMPDNWDTSIYELQNVNSSTASFDSNVISLYLWENTFESNGTVFLPAAGLRLSETSLFYLNSQGTYWFSTCHGSYNDHACQVWFSNNGLSTSAGNRSSGLSVRLVRDVVTQTVNLNQGWNWFSSNVEITLDSLKVALVTALPDTSIIIKSRTQNTAYNPGTNQWRGTLTSFDVTQMYMVYVSTECEITLTGMPINPTEHPVIISNGSNWIAFPFGESMTVSNAFAGFAVEGDKVKSRNNNTQYTGGLWRGQLTRLVPGQGYIYISNTQETRMFTFPLSTK